MPISRQPGQPLPTISPLKKFVFALLVAVVFFATLEGLLWIAGVKTDLEASDRYAGFVSHVPHFVARSMAEGATVMEVAPHKMHVLNNLSFARDKPPGTYRIVCIGGSSTFGRPYFDSTSFPGWLRLFLPAAAPTQKWEVINAGAISYASYREEGLLEELAQYQPDLFILYLGQNEFLERRTYENLLNQPAWLRELAALSGHTRTAALVRRGLATTGLLSGIETMEPVLPGEVQGIPVDAVGPDAYHRDDALRREVVDHFRASLNRMLATADRVGARVILVIPASNLADFVPFKSEPAAKLSSAERQTWQLHFARALSLTQRARFQEALVELDEAAAIDDTRADLHFARGQLLLGLGQNSEAARSFRRAKDEDVCPLRAIEPIEAVVRQAAKSPNILSLDLDAILSQQAPHGIPDKTQFHDHVHLTVASNQLLARAIIEQLAAAGIAKLRPDWDAQSADELAAGYQVTWDRPRMARELLRLTALLISLKQEVMAIAQLQEVFNLAGESPEIADLAAKQLDQVAGGRLTIGVLRQNASLHPESATAQCQLGIALVKRRQFNAALPAFDAALAIDPDSRQGLHFAGLICVEIDKLDLAEDHFRHLIDVAPDLVSGHENLARTLEKQGREDEARRQWEIAATLKPENPVAPTKGP